MPPTAITLNHLDTNRYKFPHEIVEVDDDVNKKLLRDFQGEKTGFVQVGPKKYFLPIRYKEDAERIYNFRPRPDDVWIVTFPRSGTTWTQEMVWMIANDLDFKRSAEIPLLLRFPFFEYSSMIHRGIKQDLMNANYPDKEKMDIVDKMDEPMWEAFDNMQEKRFIKTHLPFSLLPPDLTTCGCKIIYVARNPKDVAVSYYHLNRFMKTLGYINDFPTFWNYFQDNLLNWSPYFEHIKEGWERRNNKNILFLFYENMNKDFRSSLKSVAAFLDKSLTDEQYDKLQEHLDIKNFRNNPSLNFDLLNQVGVSVKGEQAFIRTGKSGNWESVFDAELNAKADKWIEANLSGTDIKFPTAK